MKNGIATLETGYQFLRNLDILLPKDSNFTTIYPRKMKTMFTHTNTANLFFFFFLAKLQKQSNGEGRVSLANDVGTITHPYTRTKK